MTVMNAYIRWALFMGTPALGCTAWNKLPLPNDSTHWTHSWASTSTGAAHNALSREEPNLMQSACGLVAGATIGMCRGIKVGSQEDRN